MIKKVILSIILIVFLFTLTGCYDANTIENSYYIVALGIDLNDKDPINPYHISIQIAKNKALIGLVINININPTAPPT